MKNIQKHLRVLIRLSMVDNDFDETEKNYIYSIGKVHNISEREVNEMIKEVSNDKNPEPIHYQALSAEERFAFLYDAIQVMKIDRVIHMSEIKFCERIAERIGYQTQVIKSLSSKIYSDPKITTNKSVLLKESNKFLKNK